MLSTIKKEVLVVSILFVVVISFIVFSMTKEFMVYDLIYMMTFTSFYIRYLKLKKKQKDCIDM